MKNSKIKKNYPPHEGDENLKKPFSMMAILSIAVLMAFFMVPNLAFAGNTDSAFSAKPNDYYVNILLEGLLGNVINPNSMTASSTFTGNGTLGEVFKVFNLGVAFFGSIIIMFVAVVGIMQTGNEGEFLGRKWSSFWVPVRFGLGAAIMLPVTNAGYSFVQALCLWIAGQGVYFADSVWEALVLKVADKTNQTIINTQTNPQSVVAGIMQSTLCTEFYNKKMKDDSTPLVKYDKTNWVTTADNTNTYGQVTKFAVWTNKSDLSENLTGTQNRICGMVSYTYNSKINTSMKSVTEAFETVHDTKIAGASNLYTEMLPYATEIVESLDNPDTTVLTQKSKAAAEFIKIKKQEYETALLNAYTANVTTTPLGSAVNLSELMKQLGFASAGGFYLNLAKLQDVVRDGLNNMPKYTPPDAAAISNVPGSVDYDSVINTLQKYIDDGTKLEQTNFSYTTKQGGTGPAVKNNNMDPESMFKEINETSWTTGIALSIKDAIIGNNVSNQSLEVLYDTMIEKKGAVNIQTELGKMYGAASSGRSAIMGLKDTGDTILWIAGTVQVAFIGAKGWVDGKNATWVGKGVNAASGLGTGFASILESISMIVYTLVMGLTTIGIMLAVVIPMTPFMVWVMGIAGLMILLIEALVASVIWAVMIMHPSGEGITSDHSRQGLMILLMLFMRPALMVMGLSASIFMVDPIFQFMNDMFAFAFRGTQGSGFSGLFIIFGMCTVYATLSLSLIKKCFSMIHLVPDRVLRWVGGGGESLGESELSDRAESMAGAAGNRISQIRPNGGQRRQPQAVPGTLKPDPLKAKESDQDNPTVSVKGAVNT